MSKRDSVAARVGVYSSVARSNGDSALFANVFDEIAEIVEAQPVDILDGIREAVHCLKMSRHCLDA